MSIVNGSGNPRLVVTKIGGEVVTIDLPKPLKPGGNEEDPKEELVIHDTFDHESIVDRLGFKPRFTLDFSTWIDGLDLLSLRHILARNVEKIVFTPHVDLPSRQFEVRVVNFGTYKRIGPASGGQSGHSGVKIVLESIKLLDSIPFPQATLSGKTWEDMGDDTWNDHTADVWYFYF